MQTVLPFKSISVAIAAVPFFLTLGGALFIPVSQTLFQSALLKGIETNAPQLDAHLFARNGATEIRSLLVSMNQQSELDAVLQAYVYDLRHTFWVAAACAAAAFIAAGGLEWKSVKRGHGQEKAKVRQVEAVIVKTEPKMQLLIRRTYMPNFDASRSKNFAHLQSTDVTKFPAAKVKKSR